jgi:DNA-directed RNA polymerase beta' subunit
MDTDTREISSISFGIYSTKEILDMSVCKIDNAKKSGYGSVYDERLGTTESSKQCETCGENAQNCNGHFGHIEFNEPIINPLHYRRVISFLHCICYKCNRLLLLKDQIYLTGINKSRGEIRFNKIQEKIKKVDMCCHENCGYEQPKYKFCTTDNSIHRIYESKDKQKTSVVLSTEEILKNLTNIPDSDVELMGFDPKLIHPRNFIIEVLPVLPTCARPYVKADGNMCDDDLTNQYIEIVKTNNHLSKDNIVDKKELSEIKRQKYLATLKFRVLTTFNNSQGKAKHTTNGRAIKGIKERLAGKDGQLRSNLLGKRSVKFDVMIWEWNGGMKRAEDVVVGDVLIGDDGLPRTVVDTLEGRSLLYKVKQSDGEDYSVSCEHILTLKFCGHAVIGWRPTQSKHGGWSMKWYDRDSKTVKSIKVSVEPPLSVEDAKNELIKFMKDNNLEKQNIRWNPKRKNAGTWRVCWSENGTKKSKEIAVVIGKTKEQAYEEIVNYRNSINVDPVIDIHIKDYMALAPSVKRLMLGIKLSTPIQWPKKDVVLDPRILGMWLGDGCKDRSVFTNPDKELIEYFKDWTEKQGGKFHTYPDNLHHGISGCGFLDFLRHYGLEDNKHIPEEYIVNDVQTRLELLAGLIDTDGSVECGGATVIITQCFQHKAIIDGAKRVATSLGFRTNVAVKKTTWTTRGEKKSGEALSLLISGNISMIPTLLERKKCRDSQKDMSVTKIDVVEDGVERFCGFEVDGNNRFILGGDATITHNCNQTGRTVIGPDPTLKLGQLGVPYEMGETLSFPERVTRFNINELQELVNKGRVDSLLKPDGITRINLKRFRRGSRLLGGDIIIRGEERIEVKTGKELVVEGDKVERNGEIVEKIVPANRLYKIQEGWIVERYLQDGDYVLLNRQPTLHKASMMAMEVVLKPYKTLRMNLAITKPFNADFDGDEMNIHAPQSLESMAELKMLSAAQWNLISAQSSKPNMAIVQDSLLGAYRMTLGMVKITRDQFFNVSNKLELEEPFLDRVEHIKKVLKEKGKNTYCFTGKGLISLFLPKDLIYEKKNDADTNEPCVKIDKGVLYEGTFDKSVLGSSHNSLIQVINKEYGPASACHFIDCIHFVTNEWNLIKLFTVGLGDCLISSQSKQDEINNVINKCYIEGDGIKTTTNHDGIREMRVNAALGKAKDVGLRIAKESFSENNNFLSTVKSGSKGDFFNIAQITGLLGQQNLKGFRVPLYLNNGRRSLPHYPFENMTSEMEYESRGFVASSFINGLNPREFYFHAMSGREGISDTAMGTATSGYMQRRIIKLTEDIKIQSDNSVRDTSGHIYQLVYGENGFDPTCTVKVKGDQEMCDISRMVDKLNMEEEASMKK